MGGKYEPDGGIPILHDDLVYDMPTLTLTPPPLNIFFTRFALISGMTLKSRETAEFRGSAEKFKACSNLPVYTLQNQASNIVIIK